MRTDTPLTPLPESFWRSLMNASIPRNNPTKYIDSHEIAERMGVKPETGWMMNSKDRWPFKPVARVSNICYYDRQSAEMWLTQYLERKARLRMQRQEAEHATPVHGE